MLPEEERARLAEEEKRKKKEEKLLAVERQKLENEVSEKTFHKFLCFTLITFFCYPVTGLWLGVVAAEVTVTSAISQFSSLFLLLCKDNTDM